LPRRAVRPLPARLALRGARRVSARESIAARDAGRPTAWWGMAVVIASEGTLLTAMLATYVYLRFHTASWPPDGVAPPKLAGPLAAALVLAATSVPMWLAWRATQAGRLAATRALVAGALVVQAAYLAYQLHDLHDQLQTTPAGVNAYTSIYYTLLGA